MHRRDKCRFYLTTQTVPLVGGSKALEGRGETLLAQQLLPDRNKLGALHLAKLELDRAQEQFLSASFERRRIFRARGTQLVRSGPLGWLLVRAQPIAWPLNSELQTNTMGRELERREFGEQRTS